MLQSLNAALLSHDSATLTLDRWCADHRLASPAKITAERVKGQDKPATAELRQALGVSDAEPIAYRRVRLRCGAHVLSEADNWYVPSRLTPEMNRQLETTDIAFGRAVQALKFRRRTLSAELLWSPLLEGWEMGAPARCRWRAAWRCPPSCSSIGPSSPCPTARPSVKSWRLTRARYWLSPSPPARRRPTAP